MSNTDIIIARQRELAALVEKQQKEIDALRDASGVHEDVANKGVDDPVSDFGDKSSYKLRGSTWDCTMLIGHGIIPPLESNILCVLHILALLTQVMIAYIIFSYYLEDKWNKSMFESILRWRISTAHHVKNIDPMSNTSLASRLCAGVYGAPYGLATDYVTSQHYLQSGLVSLNLSLFVWLAVIFALLARLASFANAIRSLKLDTTVIDVHEGRITSLSPCRMWSLLCCTIVPRLIIVLCYGYVVTVYLCISNGMAEMLEVVVIITFILFIDELVYEAFMPTGVKHVVEVLKPITFPTPFSENKVVRGLNSVLSLLLALIILICVSATCTRSDSATNVTNAFCSGNVDFVYTVNPNTSAVVARSSFAIEDSIWTTTELDVLSVMKPSLGEEYFDAEVLSAASSTSSLGAATSEDIDYVMQLETREIACLAGCS